MVWRHIGVAHPPWITKQEMLHSGNQTWQWKIIYSYMMFPLQPPFVEHWPSPCLIAEGYSSKSLYNVKWWHYLGLSTYPETALLIIFFFIIYIKIAHFDVTWFTVYGEITRELHHFTKLLWVDCLQRAGDSSVKSPTFLAISGRVHAHVCTVCVYIYNIYIYYRGR